MPILLENFPKIRETFQFKAYWLSQSLVLIPDLLIEIKSYLCRRRGSYIKQILPVPYFIPTNQIFEAEKNIQQSSVDLRNLQSFQYCVGTESAELHDKCD